MGLIIFMIRYLVLMVALTEAATAVIHPVGGTDGWAVQSSTSLYSTWAKSRTFVVGDAVEFTLDKLHDVLEVTEKVYDTCTLSTSLINGVPSSTSPVSFTLTNTTARYFICPLGDHCKSGQKLALTSVLRNVSATDSTTTPTTSGPSLSGSSASMPTAALLPALLSTVAILSFLITI